MLAIQILIFTAVAVLAGIHIYRWLSDRNPAFHHEVIVTLDNSADVGYRGILTGRAGGWIQLERMTIVQPGEPAQLTAGRTLLPISRVVTLQIVPTSLSGTVSAEQSL
jgi:hypothetical protein